MPDIRRFVIEATPSYWSRFYKWAEGQGIILEKEDKEHRDNACVCRDRVINGTH